MRRKRFCQQTTTTLCVQDPRKGLEWRYKDPPGCTGRILSVHSLGQLFAYALWVGARTRSLATFPDIFNLRREIVKGWSEQGGRTTSSHLVVKHEQVVIECCAETDKQDLDWGSALGSSPTLFAEDTSFWRLTVKNNCLRAQHPTMVERETHIDGRLKLMGNGIPNRFY